MYGGCMIMRTESQTFDHLFLTKAKRYKKVGMVPLLCRKKFISFPFKRKYWFFAKMGSRQVERGDDFVYYFKRNTNKKEKGIKGDGDNSNRASELTIRDLFCYPFYMDVSYTNEATLEVYHESKMEDGWEVPGIFIGIRLYEGTILKENFVLHSSADFGFFSYTSVKRHLADMEMAISIAEFMANKILSECEMYGYKVKKRFISKNHVYLLKIPTDYTINMPEPEENLNRILDEEIVQYDLHRKKIMKRISDNIKEKGKK